MDQLVEKQVSTMDKLAALRVWLKLLGPALFGSWTKFSTSVPCEEDFRNYRLHNHVHSTEDIGLNLGLKIYSGPLNILSQLMIKQLHAEDLVIKLSFASIAAGKKTFSVPYKVTQLACDEIADDIADIERAGRTLPMMQGRFRAFHINASLYL